MRPLTTDVLRGLLKGGEPPRISLYQPTHRANPDNLQDSIRYKNLVRDAERSLREKYSGREVRPLLEPFQALSDDYHFGTGWPSSRRPTRSRCSNSRGGFRSWSWWRTAST